MVCNALLKVAARLTTACSQLSPMETWPCHPSAFLLAPSLTHQVCPHNANHTSSRVSAGVLHDHVATPLNE